MIRQLRHNSSSTAARISDLFYWQFPGGTCSFDNGNWREGCSAGTVMFPCVRIVDIIVDNIRTGDVEFAGRQKSSSGVIAMHLEGGLPSPARNAFLTTIIKILCRRVIYAFRTETSGEKNACYRLRNRNRKRGWPRICPAGCRCCVPLRPKRFRGKGLRRGSKVGGTQARGISNGL